MDIEDFCSNYCPVAHRLLCRDGKIEAETSNWVVSQFTKTGHAVNQNTSWGELSKDFLDAYQIMRSKEYAGGGSQ